MHADLFASETDFSPRPAWQVIEAARRQMLTGELTLATTPTTRVYLRDGQVYFAERSTDGALGVRLLVEGVITRQQMGKGALLAGAVEHLGRMFQRDATIDREAVELCVEMLTDGVLTTIADDVVEHYVMTMYQRHLSGIDRWLPNRVEIITRIVEGSHLSEPARANVVPGEAAHPAAAQPVTRAVAPVVAPVEPTPIIIDSLVGATAMKINFREWEPITAENFFGITSTLHTAPSADSGMERSADDFGVSRALSAVDEMMSSTIADEVAEAVRRALSAVDAAQPASM